MIWCSRSRPSMRRRCAVRAPMLRPAARQSCRVTEAEHTLALHANVQESQRAALAALALPSGLHRPCPRGSAAHPVRGWRWVGAGADARGEHRGPDRRRGTARGLARAVRTREPAWLQCLPRAVCDLIRHTALRASQWSAATRIVFASNGGDRKSLLRSPCLRLTVSAGLDALRMHAVEEVKLPGQAKAVPSHIGRRTKHRGEETSPVLGSAPAFEISGLRGDEPAPTAKRA